MFPSVATVLLTLTCCMEIAYSINISFLIINAIW